MKTKNYEEILNENGTLCWKTVGISMRPLIRENKDIIIIRKLQKPPQKYDVVLFRRPGVTGRGEYVLHRIIKRNIDGTYWIVGDNCCTGENVKEENILGVLSEMVRGKKQIHLRSPLYIIYIHLWCDFWPIRYFIVRYRSYPVKIIKKVLGLLESMRI